MSARALDGDGPAKLLARTDLQACLAALRARGEETRLVGGCVRDALLGGAIADIDLATTLPPARTMERAEAAGIKAVPTGFDHGTVTLVVGGKPFEVTTLREDIETDGRHAVVRFGRDFARDAERRDFTINALSLGEDGTLHDKTGGRDDLAAGRVRFIGDAETRIREDGLRILRFFRFHARFGLGPPDATGLAAAVRARGTLEHVSRERVRSEMLRLLVAPGVLETMAAMAETGFVTGLLGSPGEFGRLARVVAFEAASGLPPDGVRRLAAFAVFSPEDAPRLEAALRLSRTEAARLGVYAGAVARLRSEPRFGADDVRRVAIDVGLPALEDAFIALDGEPWPQPDGAAREALTALRSGGEAVPVFPLTGADLLSDGARPGRGIGIGLAAARKRWIDEGCPSGADTKARLLDVARAAYAEVTSG